MAFKKRIFFFTFFISVVVFSQEKQIENVIFKGLQKTKISFLKRFLETKSNSRLDSSQLEKDIIRLKRLPAFTNAAYQIIEKKNKEVDVVFLMEENFTIIPDLNFWTTTNKRFAYKIGLYDYNFLGKNITFGGFYQYNGFDSYGINFKAPNLFSRNWGLAINHQNWTSEEPLFFNNQTANYKYNNVSIEALALYQINFKNEINFGINFFTEKYEYLFGATDASIPQNLNVNKVLFKFVYSYDNLDYFYQYINGFKSVLQTQYVSSKNDFQENFLIAWNDFFYFRRIGERGNWANRMRFGLSSNQDSPFAPFTLDNNINLRGVGILVDRGTGSIVLNSEYRYSFVDEKNFAVQSNFFVDAGSWRNPGKSLGDFLTEKNIRVFTGVGLRFISKKIYNATFRIDYGIGLTKNSAQGFVFGIGQYF